jgi:hypothetical protein
MNIPYYTEILQELNDHVRKVLSDLLAGRCAQCNLNATSSNTPPDKCIELTIRRIDQMNIKLESLTSTKLT